MCLSLVFCEGGQRHYRKVDVIDAHAKLELARKWLSEGEDRHVMIKLPTWGNKITTMRLQEVESMPVAGGVALRVATQDRFSHVVYDYSILSCECQSVLTAFKLGHKQSGWGKTMPITGGLMVRRVPIMPKEQVAA